MLKSIISAAALASSLICGSVFAASDPSVVYVIRPPVPGKAAGVLGPGSFVTLKPTTPGNGSGATTPPASDGGYTFKSSNFDTRDIPVVEVTMRNRPYPEQDDYLIIKAASIAKNMVCRLEDQYGTPTQPFVSSGAFLNQSNNMGQVLVRPMNPGKFAVTVSCQSLDPNDFYGGYLHHEKFIITVTN